MKYNVAMVTIITILGNTLMIKHEQFTINVADNKHFLNKSYFVIHNSNYNIKLIIQLLFMCFINVLNQLKYFIIINF